MTADARVVIVRSLCVCGDVLEPWNNPPSCDCEMVLAINAGASNQYLGGGLPGLIDRSNHSPAVVACEGVLRQEYVLVRPPLQALITSFKSI